MFDWDKFKNSKFVVWCKTEEKAINFIESCIKHLGKGINYKVWRENGEDTCFRFYTYGLLYANTEHYQKQNYEIVEWEE